VIEKNTSTGLPFELHGEIEVTKNFATVRHIKLRMSNFSIQSKVH
jgi:hypothetical protein